MARCLRGQAGTGVIELFLASVIGWLFGMPFLAITLFFTMKYLDPKNTKKEVNLLGRTIKLRPILAYCILVLALSAIIFIVQGGSKVNDFVLVLIAFPIFLVFGFLWSIPIMLLYLAAKWVGRKAGVLQG